MGADSTSSLRRKNCVSSSPALPIWASLDTRVLRYEPHLFPSRHPNHGPASPMLSPDRKPTACTLHVAIGGHNRSGALKREPEPDESGMTPFGGPFDTIDFAGLTEPAPSSRRWTRRDEEVFWGLLLALTVFVVAALVVVVAGWLS